MAGQNFCPSSCISRAAAALAPSSLVRKRTETSGSKLATLETDEAAAAARLLHTKRAARCSVLAAAVYSKPKISDEAKGTHKHTHDGGGSSQAIAYTRVCAVV